MSKLSKPTRSDAYNKVKKPVTPHKTSEDPDSSPEEERSRQPPKQLMPERRPKPEPTP